METIDDVELPSEEASQERDDGCGECLPCRYLALLKDMLGAIKLRAGQEKEAEKLLCAAIEAGGTTSPAASGTSRTGAKDEEDDLAGMVAAGRA